VVEKHKQIYPRKQELDLVLSLSDKTERALKKVSDKLCTKVRDEMLNKNSVADP
jgi:hypothetical protein